MAMNNWIELDSSHYINLDKYSEFYIDNEGGSWLLFGVSGANEDHRVLLYFRSRQSAVAKLREIMRQYDKDQQYTEST